MPGFNIQTDGGCGAGACEGGYTGPNSQVETGRAHRYRLKILQPVQNILLYAYKCQRPVAEVDRIVLHRGQDEIYKPGKSRWLPIEVTFYEIVQGYNLTAQYLNKWWGKDMVQVQSSLLSPDSIYKKNCQLEMDDGCGNPIWMYYLYGVWPSKVTPSELNYTSTDLSEISCTLEISKAMEMPT